MQEIFRKFSSFLGRLFKRHEDGDDIIKYWENRSKTFGKRAVLNLGHSEKEYDDVTFKQKEIIFPYFINELTGEEKIVVDFGCGPGRFTIDLAYMINGKAIGLDVVSEFVNTAPRHDLVEYKVISEGVLPLPDGSVDIVWACLVFGGLKGEILKSTINEIDRVLRDNGLLFLVENTSQKPDGDFWFFRTFDAYQDYFPYVKLKHLKDYYDLEETISIMAGRKSN